MVTTRKLGVVAVNKKLKIIIVKESARELSHDIIMGTVTYRTAKRVYYKAINFCGMTVRKVFADLIFVE